MARSSRLRLTDVRAVAALAGECRELGDDTRVWRGHLLAGLARLTGAGLGMAAEQEHFLRGARGCLGAAMWGLGTGFDPAGWRAAAAAAARDPHYHPVLNAFAARLPRDDGLCRSRQDLVPDPDWYRSAYYDGIHRVLGGDATLACYKELPGRPAEFAEVYLLRPAGEPEFAARDKAVVREAVAVVAPLIGGPLARFTEPAPSALPSRARQVLRCLLDGDSDKQIAARLGLRPLTVNQHVKRVFRHFGVQTRAELLARWLKRGWGSRAAWADDLSAG